MVYHRGGVKYAKAIVEVRPGRSMQCQIFSPGISSSCILPSKAVETAEKSAPVGKTPGLGKYAVPVRLLFVSTFIKVS